MHKANYNLYLTMHVQWLAIFCVYVRMLIDLMLL